MISIEQLKQSLESGAKLVFAKRLNEKAQVRSCYVIQFDRRKGFHIVEQKARQIRITMENEGGVYFLALKDDKIRPVTEFGDALVRELPEDREEEIFQLLPRYDFTAQVQAQRLMKKIGYFR